MATTINGIFIAITIPWQNAHRREKLQIEYVLWTASKLKVRISIFANHFVGATVWQSQATFLVTCRAVGPNFRTNWKPWFHNLNANAVVQCNFWIWFWFTYSKLYCNEHQRSVLWPASLCIAVDEALEFGSEGHETKSGLVRKIQLALTARRLWIWLSYSGLYFVVWFLCHVQYTLHIMAVSGALNDAVARDVRPAMELVYGLRACGVEKDIDIPQMYYHARTHNYEISCDFV